MKTLMSCYVGVRSSNAPLIKVLLKTIGRIRPEINLRIMLQGVREYDPQPDAVDGEEEQSARKEASKTRKAAIIAQIASNQDAFMRTSEYVAIADELEEELEMKTNAWAFPRGACILCQEEVTDDIKKMYGMVSFYHPASTQSVDLTRRESAVGVMNCSSSFNRASARFAVDPGTTDIKHVTGNATIDSPISFEDQDGCAASSMIASSCGMSLCIFSYNQDTLCTLHVLRSTACQLFRIVVFLLQINTIPRTVTCLSSTALFARP
jgi:uncharacterized protein (DUF2126 family)